jgi:hypothetical protein
MLCMTELEVKMVQYIQPPLYHINLLLTLNTTCQYLVIEDVMMLSE